MPYVTDLLALSRDTLHMPDKRSAPRLHWRRFGARLRESFIETVQRTSMQTLDLPELGQLGILEHLIEEEVSRNEFDHDLWQLGFLEGETQPAAVLMLQVGNEPRVAELRYMGLAPEYRHKGFGRSLVHQAVHIAAGFADRIGLAVDIRNTPATRLYQSTGFCVIERRAVYLSLL
jgi:ribosomal protein S18 acetylase RimI-like enzyme